jgi:hypothetical protein
MRWKGTAPEEIRAARRRRITHWYFHFAWRPKQFEDGTWAWLETIAARNRDGDGMRPWVYGPVANVLTQPPTLYSRRMMTGMGDKEGA